MINSQRSSSTVDHVHHRRQELSTTDRRLLLVYITLGNGGRAVAKFSESGVWDKVLEGRWLPFLKFRDTIISLNTA